MLPLWVLLLAFRLDVWEVFPWNVILDLLPTLESRHPDGLLRDGVFPGAVAMLVPVIGAPAAEAGGLSAFNLELEQRLPFHVPTLGGLGGVCQGDIVWYVGVLHRGDKDYLILPVVGFTSHADGSGQGLLVVGQGQ